MAKQISQDTFDAVVRENISDFDMEIEEAVNDAIQQFEAQGVNLANIVKDLNLYSNNDVETTKHPVIAASEELQKELLQNHYNIAILKDCAKRIQEECDIDLARRCLAGKSGAYSVLLSACMKFEADEECLDCFMSALCSLCNGQPDLLDEKGIVWNCCTLKSDSVTSSIAALLVKFMRLNCVKHETNRQKYVANNIIAILSRAMAKYSDSPTVLKETCGALRVLTYDDDVRVPFGKGHEHAKMIVTEENALRQIMDICKNFKEHESLLAELYQTLSCLAVRNEFCQEIMDLGGVKLMLGTVESNPDNQALVKQVLGVLKTIAGNDKVKMAIVEANGISLILCAMEKHLRNTPISEMGCAALTALSLRNPDHSNKIMAEDGAETVVKAMIIHKNKASLQKQACMLIRNIVARCREHCQVFIELRIEDLVRTAMLNHPECHDEAKAALRDLGLKVELRELWTGEGKGITA